MEFPPAVLEQKARDLATGFGYTDKPVTELDPDHVISHFDELYDAIRALT